MRAQGEGTYKQLRAAHREERTRTVFFFLGLASVIGWAYVIFMSDLFVITSVQATGLKALDPVDVEREAFEVLDERGGWRPWSPRHSWFIDQRRLEQELNNRLFAESVTVDKITPHVLRLSIEERSKKLIFHTHQQYVWVDLQGVVTSVLNPDERKQAQARILGSRVATPDEPPLVHVDLDELIDAGYVVGDGKTIRLWIQNATEIVKAGLAYREFEPPDTVSSTTAVLKAPDGYDVLVDMDEAMEPQIRSYLAFKKSQPADLKVSQYVDARIPGRVYVK